MLGRNLGKSDHPNVYLIIYLLLDVKHNLSNEYIEFEDYFGAKIIKFISMKTLNARKTYISPQKTSFGWILYTHI